jgi:hypothetical protein
MITNSSQIKDFFSTYKSMYLTYESRTNQMDRGIPILQPLYSPPFHLQRRIYLIDPEKQDMRDQHRIKTRCFPMIF